MSKNYPWLCLADLCIVQLGVSKSALLDDHNQIVPSDFAWDEGLKLIFLTDIHNSREAPGI